MFEQAEARGDLKPGMRVLECSTGNAGIACAFVAAVKAYACTIVMPAGMSEERKKLMRAYGAELVFTPGGESDVDLSLRRLAEIRAADPGGYWVPGQFDNEDNVEAHRRTTGPEIWEQCGGVVGAFVAAQGSGGTLTGVGRFLRAQDTHVRLYAVEPAECALLARRAWGPHGIEGIGDGFIPDNLDVSLLSGVITTTTEESVTMARRLAAEEGIFCGISSGCNVAAALKLAAPAGTDVDRHHDQRHGATLLHHGALRRDQARGRPRARASHGREDAPPARSIPGGLGDPGLNPAEYDFVAARRRLEGKAKSAGEKLTTLEDAAARVRDGDHVAGGGCLFSRTPLALVREILRSRRRGLTLSRNLMCTEGELMMAAGAADRVVTAWMSIGLPWGVSRILRHYVETGKVALEEWSHLALGLRFRAAAMGVPFLPALTMLGSDLVGVTGLKTVQDPYTGETLAAVPALFPDVALLHVHRADRFGNAQIDGYPHMDADIARAAHTVLMTAEEIIPEDETRRHPDRTIIPGFLVDALVHVPFGSFPHECYGLYEADFDHFEEYTYAIRARGPEAVGEYLQRHVYGPPTWDEYLESFGGARLARQRAGAEPRMPAAWTYRTSSWPSWARASFATTPRCSPASAYPSWRRPSPSNGRLPDSPW